MSLGTRCFRLAEAFCEALDEAFESFFAKVQMTAFDITGELRRYLAEERAKLRARHLATPYGYRIHGGGDYAPDAHKRDLQSINVAIATLREALVTRADFMRTDQAAAIIGHREATHEERVELALGLLQADLQVMEQSRDWLTTGIVPTIDEGVEERPAPVAPTVEVATAKKAKPAETGPKFSEVLPRFLKQMEKDEGWRGQTLQQNKATYRMFTDHWGDKPVQDYTRKHCTSFFDVLKELPRDYGQRPEYRNLKPRQIADMARDNGVDRIGMKTVKRHASALGRLFTFLKKRGEYEGENPAHGHEFPMKGRKVEKRQMWEGERLEKLFKSPVWTGCHSDRERSKPGGMIIKDDKFWLPLLGLYHGNRLEEFAQLIRADVRQEDGVWYFDINEDQDDKQVKNEQSHRRVPIHPVLISMGFLDYLKDAAPKSEDRVFPELKPGGPDGKKGFYFTKWWSRYRQQIGVGAKGLDYHSFRHGVTTKLAAAGVTLDYRNQLLGREGSSTDEQVYLKALPLKQLAEAIGKVEWPELAWLADD
jgi:integrase